MSTRSVKVVLEAEVDRYVQNLKKAGKATDDAGKAAAEAGKQIDKAQEQAAKSTDKSTDANKKHSESGKESAKGSEESAKGSKNDAEAKARQAEAAEKAGGTLLAFGATSATALGASAKAAMDWESAWAGVTKTVDGTPEQMAEIETGLRGLAKTLPSTHQEIAAVAEAAGQLGVKRESILSFTKTMVDLGETTNLTAEDAATAIAQIANVMQTSGNDVDNFGSTLVALGNAGASTEKDILSMAQRIAGAGKLVGASESDVLALSNTLASMGVNAELGGGVTTRVLLKLYTAVQNGGKGLENFAKVAGVSSQEFATAFSTSPVAALDMVTKGLARTKAEGGNVVSTMTELGIKGTEETQVMLSLVGAGNLLTDSLNLGNKAWAENSALTDEANKRYETTASQVKVAWNNIKDAAIDAGAVILPVVQGVAESVSGLASSFGDLPDPVQRTITTLGGVIAVGALVGGTLLTVTPKIRDGAQAFKDLDTRADGSSRGMGKMAKTAGIAGAGLTALIAGGQIFNEVFGKADVTTTQFTQGLLSIGKGTESLDALFRDGGLGIQIDGIGDAIARMNDKVMFDEFSLWVGDLGFGSKLNTLRDNIDGVDRSLSNLIADGKGQEAAAAFQAIAKAAEAQGVPIEKLVDMFPQYRDKLLDAKNAAGETNVTQEMLAESMLKGGEAGEKAGAGADAAAEGLTKVTGVSGNAVIVTEEVADALAEIGINAQGAVVDLVKFTDALLATGAMQLSARDASRGWAQALADLGLQADASGGQIGILGTAFDNNTEQGRKNQAVFDATAQAGMRNVEAMAANKASNEEVLGALVGTYNGLIAAAGQFGITGDAAINLARDVLGVPDGVTIDSWMSDEAKRMAQTTTGELDKIDGRVVTVTTRNIEETHRISYEKRVAASNGAEPGGGGLYGSDSGRAAGGAIYGPGTSTSDEAGLFPLSNGEHVFDAADVQKMGGQQAVYKFRANLHSDSPGYAAGGAIGTAVASTSIMAQTRFSQPARAGTGRRVEQHFHGVTDPVSLAYHAARIQEEG
ncbi:phage tail tape measure protein [Pseudarthrobacter oxydans]|uniref:phage tail tape measure protein n=1 Tax=Pseudarthrobacter oxydans TaxID=1671 RepID=UPI00157401F0|nr:phage tail tape measure protein [Pseudarthrobacter oxydans]NSX37828.1 phage tail tape measure protein [Pseudarthrobacter oxydans]